MDQLIKYGHPSKQMSMCNHSSPAVSLQRRGSAQTQEDSQTLWHASQPAAWHGSGGFLPCLPTQPEPHQCDALGLLQLSVACHGSACEESLLLLQIGQALRYCTSSGARTDCAMADVARLEALMMCRAV